MFVVWTINPMFPSRIALASLSRTQARRMQTNGTSQLPDQRREKRTTSSIGLSHWTLSFVSILILPSPAHQRLHLLWPSLQISYYHQCLYRTANGLTPSKLSRHLLALLPWRALSCTAQCGSSSSLTSSSACLTRWSKMLMSDVHICQTSR